MTQHARHIRSHRKLIVAALMAAIAAVGLAGGMFSSLAAQSTNDETAVRAVMQGYIEASKNPDEKAMRALFHPDALMSGALAGGQMRVGKPEGFFASLGKQAAGAAQPYGPASITQIVVVGDVATGTIEEANFRGNKYTDFFQLVRLDGKWLIVSKSWAGTKIAP